VLLGRVYHATKKYTDGRAVLEEAIQINPFNPVIYRLLADIYTAEGDQDKAKLAKATLDKLLTAK
jgi:cytochrome c-type biogenesis protein CcmH/NrfG